MGRAKLTLELRNNKKARRITFEKRRKGLEKKAYELSTLCGVKIGMILYGPAEGDELVEPTIWPENREEIENLISSYKKRSNDDSRQKTYDLSFFFKDQVKKVEEELAKTRKKNNETKYPSWNESYDNLTIDELKYFSNLLQARIENVKSRINLMNQNQMDSQENIYIYQSKLYYQQQQQQQQSLMPTYDPQIIDTGSFNMANSRLTMIMPMNDGASSSSSNYIRNPEYAYGNYMESSGYEFPVSHDLGFGIIDNVPFPKAKTPLMCRYLYPMPQFSQCEYPMFSSPTLQLQEAKTEDYHRRHDFQLRNPM